jgi:D-galactosamine 6-phosphate deaminase/isomerase
MSSDGLVRGDEAPVFEPRGNLRVSALSELLSLPDSEKTSRGLAHTPAEIAQQPDAWLSTFEIFQRNQSRILKFLSSAGLSATSTSRPTVFLIGAGTSDYVGHALASLLRKLWRCEVITVPSTDLLTHMQDVLIPQRNCLCISFSRSGNTAEGVAVLEKIREVCPDIPHLVISCNAEGKMIREHAGQPGFLGIALDDAVNDRGLAMTSSFSNMLVFGQCLAHVNDVDTYAQILSQLVQAGKSFLPQAADCAAALAQGPYTKVCFVGSGPLRAVATESALKLLELTAGKTLTMSESALGLRHGPMAVLDQDTLFVCFLSGDRRVQQYERDLLMEIEKKKLVGCRVVVAGSEISANDFGADHYLAPSVSSSLADDYRPAVDVMFGQLLGLFCSLRWNLRPDCPSPNGAISRVVENLSIHG